MIIRNIFKALFILFAFILVMGCSPEDDGNPSPVPDTRDKFTGSWNVNNENCGKEKYVVTISKDPNDASQVLINNFAFSHAGQPDIGVVTGSTITVFKQTNSEGWTIEGSGIYGSDESISWNYTLIISGYQEQCTCTYLR